MRLFFNSIRWKTLSHAPLTPPALMAVVVLMLCMMAAPAWSFQMHQVDIAHEDTRYSPNTHTVSLHDDRVMRQKNPSPVQVDSCLPLLSSSHPLHVDRTQRSAGKAAALGLVFGVRFALSPPKTSRSRDVTPTARVGVWQPDSGDRSALAVSAYRECQKQQALQALNGFRFKR